MIARRLRGKQVRGEPITIENFVIDTIMVIIKTTTKFSDVIGYQQPDLSIIGMQSCGCPITGIQFELFVIGCL